MFWLLIALLAVVACGFFVVGLWRSTRNNSPLTVAEANVELYQEHLLELQRQLDRGDIGESQYRDLGVEAQRKLLTENSADSLTGARPGGAWLVVVCALVLVAGAVLLYVRQGAAPDMEIATLMQNTVPGETGPLREKLQARLADRPQNLYYWVLLARLEQSEERHTEAANAYRQALAVAPQDVTLLMEFAEAQFVAAHYKIDTGVAAIIKRALALDSANSSAHSLLGIDAYNRQDYQSAITHWQQAVNGADPMSQDLSILRSSIDQAKKMLGEPVTSALRIAVRVSLVGGKELDPQTPVFIYAREWQGMAMPLVAQRLTVADLPAEVILDDNLALSPQRTMSSVAGLELVARVAIGGTPQPASGDIEGRIGPVEPAQTEKTFELVIDRRLP